MNVHTCTYNQERMSALLLMYIQCTCVCTGTHTHVHVPVLLVGAELRLPTEVTVCDSHLIAGVSPSWKCHHCLINSQPLVALCQKVHLVTLLEVALHVRTLSHLSLYVFKVGNNHVLRHEAGHLCEAVRMKISYVLGLYLYQQRSTKRS